MRGESKAELSHKRGFHWHRIATEQAGKVARLDVVAAAVHGGEHACQRVGKPDKTGRLDGLKVDEIDHRFYIDYTCRFF